MESASGMMQTIHVNSIRWAAPFRWAGSHCSARVHTLAITDNSMSI